ncbi:MAG: SfnB family sulfur acquisition oxidoreductase [Cyanobacteria bacterium P01_H01_bin.153]
MASVLTDVKTAHVIKTDEEAVQVATAIAEELAKAASQRDAERILPYEEIEQVSQAGLTAITVPKEYGGAGVSNVTLVEVVKILSAADSSIGQIPQNHLYLVEALRLDGTESQKAFFFNEVLAGKRFGNAFSERGNKNVNDIRTRLDQTPDGYSISGKKYYSTGALFAHWIPVLCMTVIDGEDKAMVAFVERHGAGVEVIDDWACFGQTITGSGSSVFTDAPVKQEHVLHHYQAFERPTIMGPISQILHAAVDVGIAVAAFKDATAFVRENPKPWIDSGLDYNYEDPLLIHKFGEMAMKLHTAEAILRRAGEFVDAAAENMNAETVAEASIAVAESKIASEDAAMFIANALFEVSGTRSTLDRLNLDRHWRNARAHTVHDPSRWKYFAVGNYYLNDIKPPRHSYI